MRERVQGRPSATALLCSIPLAILIVLAWRNRWIADDAFVDLRVVKNRGGSRATERCRTLNNPSPRRGLDDGVRYDMCGRRVVTMLVAAISGLAWGPGRASANAIVAENARQGTAAWDVSPPAKPAIEAYASEASAPPGGAFHLHVSAPRDSRYRVELYRLGWYGGAGGRLVACRPGCGEDEPARAQPAVPRPAAGTGIVDAGWHVTDTIHVDSGWVSGYYLAVLRVTAGAEAGEVGRLPLVVRSAPGDRAATLVQVPVSTWQAYNTWGGRSLYASPDGRRKAAVKVSFNRPYAEGVPVPVPFALELPLVRFLERQGYDLGYATDVDVDRRPATLRAHRLAMAAGHGEYWSGRTRDAWDAALAGGVSLAAMGANTGYWQARYENRHRTLVVYRGSAADPERDRAKKTVPFRDLRRPECQLFGVEYQFYAQRSARQKPSEYTVVAPAADAWLRDTGLQRGDHLPGLVGYEWDTAQPHCASGKLTRLFHASPKGVDRRLHAADAVRVATRYGGHVFASGSLEFSWALDSYGGHAAEPRVQGFMRNVMKGLGGRTRRVRARRSATRTHPLLRRE